MIFPNNRFLPLRFANILLKKLYSYQLYHKNIKTMLSQIIVLKLSIFSFSILL